MTAATIDPGLLLKVLYTSLLAGVGVSVVFSFTILGLVRSGEMRRAHRSGAALSYSILAAAGLLATAAIVVYGLILLTQKS
jgi:hypothetical protein